MIPSIVIFYVRGDTERRPGTKVAKAAFVNVSDALIFWEALSEVRKRYLVMETLDGKPVKEIAHTGFIEFGGGSYSHASALTETDSLPPRERDREGAHKRGWEFVEIQKA